MEPGEREKPPPLPIKANVPFLGVSYEELMQKAGYIDEVVEYHGFTENKYAGRLVTPKKLISCCNYYSVCL